MLRASATAEDARLLELTSRPLHEEAEVAEALTLLRAHPVMDEARAEVARRAELARGYLSVLPAGSARDALSAAVRPGRVPFGLTVRAGQGRADA
jgi:heptaprenyl diphosphate synthase